MELLDKYWYKFKKIICTKLLKLEKKGYTIPVNTANGELFTQNLFINSIIFIADLICIIITLFGMEQKIVTFFGIITYSIYTLTDQIQITSNQFNLIKNKKGFFKIRKRIKKNMFPPNIKNIILISLISIVSFALSVNYFFGGTSPNWLYITIILSSFCLLFNIKVKYMIFDTFGIISWQFVEEKR